MYHHLCLTYAFGRSLALCGTCEFAQIDYKLKLPCANNVDFLCDIPGTAIAELPHSKVRSAHENYSSAVDWAREFTVGSSDNMIVSLSSASERSYRPVSFCRSCAIVSRESWHAILPSSRISKPGFYTTA